MKPTATIYQNEDGIIAIFSKIDDRGYRGGRISFENGWHDGGAWGLSGFDDRKELNEFLKENNYVKKGKVELSLYCWQTHVVETIGNKIHGGTATCMLKPNHKGKHKGIVGGFDFDSKGIEVEWIEKIY